MNNNCIACGKPLINPEDFGAKIEEGSLCKHCTNLDGKIKSCQEIFDGGVEFFMNSIPGTKKEFAEKIVRKNMNQLSYWQTNSDSCCQGEEATDEEFQATLKKL